jgi:uncharacterized protein YjbJ (UPF0337 family)
MTKSVPKIVYLPSLLPDERGGGRHALRKMVAGTSCSGDKGICVSWPTGPNVFSRRYVPETRIEPFGRAIVHQTELHSPRSTVMSMNEDRFGGSAKNVAGRVEQGFGRAAGDAKTEVEGAFKQATGAAQDAYGRAKSAAGEAYEQTREAVGEAARSVQEQAAPMEEFLRNAIESRPYTSVAVALGIGWFIGRMGGGHSDYWER